MSENANIENNEWILSDVTIIKPVNGIFEKNFFKKYNLKSIYNYEKINTLFKNYNTMSFHNLIINYDKLLKNGYSENFF